jgi:2-amino-4-hydroxy-6-hydroxymethyldihydropteridine diphosphokinase
MTRTGGQALHLYAIGIGSNRPLSCQMTPRCIVQAAMVALDLPPLSVLARSSVITTRPIGPSLRRYANAAVLIASPLPPLEMLDRMQAVESWFHRRRYRRWGDRTLDLDLLMWSGGTVRSKRLTIPHEAFRARDFVLDPLSQIAPRWRDPASGLTVRQLAARLKKAKAVRKRLTARASTTR